MSRVKAERNISYDTIRNKFYVLLYFGVENNKPIKKQITCETIKEARQILRAHEKKMEHDNAVKPKGTSFEQWSRYWLENYVKLACSITTYYAYERLVMTDFNPVFGSIPLQKISTIQIQEYIAQQMLKVGNNTIRYRAQILKSIFNFGIRQNILENNPVNKITLPPKKPIHSPFYNIQQMQDLLNAAHNTELALSIAILACMGLRKEELLGLTWDNVDLTKNIIKIDNARTEAVGHIVEKDPKNKPSIRLMAIPDAVQKLMHQEIQRRKELKKFYGDAYCNIPYVVCHEDGTPYDPCNYYYSFVEFVKKNNLPPINVRGLRHSYASAANELGASLFDISKSMGHATLKMTGDTYTHAFDVTGQKTTNLVASAYHMPEIEQKQETTKKRLMKNKILKFRKTPK